MTQYIDKEMAKRAIAAGNVHKGIIDAMQSLIDDIPAADVQEVRYGEWKKKKSATGKGFYYFCTACYPHIDHFTTHEEEFDFVKGFKYCPYCGAKMRKKEEQA